MRHRSLEARDCVDDVAHGAESPRITGTLLERERVRDADGAYDGAVRQVGLSRHARHSRDEGMLRLVRTGLIAGVECIPAGLHPEVTVFDALGSA